MGMRINSNPNAINALRNLNNNTLRMGRSLEKLASGFRINRAADDAAGLSISENLRSQIGGFKMAVRNAQDGISVIQTAEGALTEVHDLLQRMRGLVVQAANTGANDQSARNAIGREIEQSIEEIDRIAQATQFGNKQLLATKTIFTFHIGASTQSFNQINLAISGIMAATDLSLTSASIVALVTAGSVGVIDSVERAIIRVSSMRSSLGSFQNRLEKTISNLSSAVENLTASESRIRDTDMAEEMAEFTRNQILVQASTSMLAQANALPQSILQLIQG